MLLIEGAHYASLLGDCTYLMTMSCDCLLGGFTYFTIMYRDCPLGGCTYLTTMSRDYPLGGHSEPSSSYKASIMTAH